MIENKLGDSGWSMVCLLLLSTVVVDDDQEKEGKKRENRLPLELLQVLLLPDDCWEDIENLLK